LVVGAGFGRLSADFRQGFEQVVLLDYSQSQLEYARQQLGDEGYLYVAANLYKMPFAPGVFDAATLIRVIHHLEDPPAALESIRQTVRSGGVFLLEYANKLHFKAIGRWLLGRQSWSPFSPEPAEFVELNYNFHPRYISRTLKEAGFKSGRRLTVSHFRIALLKRLIPTDLLVFMDSLAQHTGDLWQLAPSVFVRTEPTGEDQPAPAGAFWRCPACGSTDLDHHADHLDCTNCGARWGIINGVYNFKDAL
jgi:SAM-dependent methyltransferase